MFFQHCKVQKTFFIDPNHDIMSGMNKNIFLDFRMLENHMKRLGFEPTTILDYSKSLVTSQGILEDRTGQNSIETKTYASALERSVH